MPVDDQIAIGTVLVLADFGCDQRRFRQLGKALAEEMTRASDAGLCRLAFGRRRIDCLSARVIGELETARAHIGKSVNDALAEVDPDRKISCAVSLRSARRAEVIDL